MKRLAKITPNMRSVSNYAPVIFTYPFFVLNDGINSQRIAALKQDAHQIFEMGLALRRKGEPLQPVFDRKRFDLVERALGPFWLYVILQP